MTGGVFSEKDGRQVPDTIMASLEYPDMLVNWQSTFSNSRYGLGEHILGDKGTIQHVSGSNDMVSGRSVSSITYLPEKMNNPDGSVLKGESKDTDHMANWFECIRDRKQPNAPVEIGYKSAIAAHMSNLAFRQKRRITLEEAMAAKMDAYL
jgi:hypothetical protein